METAEIEFMAEETLITIIPRFSCRKTHFITGEIGPFRAGIPVKVPLWLASDLRRRQKCRILLPEWMDVEVLNGLNEEETLSVKLCKTPSENFFTDAKIILNFGAEVNSSFDSITRSIKDLWDRRRAKIEEGLDSVLLAGATFFAVANITLSEMCTFRPALSLGIDFSRRFDGVGREVDEGPGALDCDSGDDSQSISSPGYSNFSSSTYKFDSSSLR